MPPIGFLTAVPDSERGLLVDADRHSTEIEKAAEHRPETFSKSVPMKLPRLSSGHLSCLVLLAALGLPSFGNAQWADARCEHDWTLTLGERTIGLRQYVHLPGEWRSTTICLGRTTVESKLKAAPPAAMILVPAGVVLLAVTAAMSVWRPGKK